MDILARNVQKICSWDSRTLSWHACFWSNIFDKRKFRAAISSLCGGIHESATSWCCLLPTSRCSQLQEVTLGKLQEVLTVSYMMLTNKLFKLHVIFAFNFKKLKRQHQVIVSTSRKKSTLYRRPWVIILGKPLKISWRSQCDIRGWNICRLDY